MSDEEKFNQLFRGLRKQHSLKVRATVLRIDGDVLTVQFIATSGAFECWRGAHLGEEMPADHPSRGQYGDSWMINGSTGYITYRKSPVGYVSLLRDRRARGVFNKSNAWHLRSKKFTAEVYLDRLLAEESAQEDLVSLLQDLLRKDKRWVSVSGDFNDR